jgi:para-aminobenzoate synthetase component 1
MIIKECACCDPVQAFESLKDRPFSFFLDSGMDPERLGRYSIMGSDPFLVFKSKGDSVSVWQEGAWSGLRANPFDVLKDMCGRYQIPVHPAVPVAAGAFGYLAYDLGWQLEKLPHQAEDDLDTPDCYLGFYDRLVVFDHLAGRAYLTSTGLPESGREAETKAEQRLSGLEALLWRVLEKPPASVPEPRRGTRRPAEAGTPARDAGTKSSEEFQITGHFDRASYRRAVQQCKDYIAAGDIFEVNLTQRFACPISTTPWQLYCRLRRINPAPFAAYLNYPELTVASASPERFLQVRGGQVETRPIKGTRRRGRDPLEDASLRQDLVSSEKDRAELVMIIDLERNDIGRVCSFGSVHVPELICLEEYPTVWHLVSTVRGTLEAGKDVGDLLKASFPGGSITGAPKIRAMEIIEELEPVKRGVYTGSIGYLGFDGRCDLNIVIRTFVIKDQVAYFHAGGAIVSDSDPDAEYWETIYKARALMQALGYSEEVVTTCLA